MKTFDVRYLPWFLYVLPALGKPVPQTRDNDNPPPAEACPIENPPVMVQLPHTPGAPWPRFTIDIGIANPRRPWTDVTGWFTVTIDPHAHTVEPGTATIYTPNNLILHPEFTAYMNHLPREIGQSRYADAWEIGVNSPAAHAIVTGGQEYEWPGVNPRVNMGCCASTNRSPPSSPYGNNTTSQGAIPTDSRAPIAVATTEASRHSTTSIRPSSAARLSTQFRFPILSSRNDTAQSSGIASHPTKPLKSPPRASQIKAPPSHSIDPLSTNPRLTYAILIRERTAYFDTRVTGHAEVWAALRIMCELLERGEKEEAQAIMEAAGCTCPSGEVWGRRGGIWDERGERYVVPAWCVGIPRGCVMEGNELQEGTDTSGVEESSEDEEVKSFRKRAVFEVGTGKGKGRAVEVEKELELESDLKVRVRMSNTAKDLVVRIRANARVHALLRRVRQVGEITPDTKIKIGYLGRILHEHESLEAQGWHEGHTLNVYVFE
ncbi:hypothetical protein FKW77_006047 [Venturia effusa]|uniref:Ubiquitin-like domain-containing protein n=1 Tax=Venturia effusa TaxID=50376 RepID=A0A517LFK8_9PEZI|nr:hypothetical protein FKW77_006047 [Venturia effusa]